MKWFQFIPQFFFNAKLWKIKNSSSSTCNICGFKSWYWFPRGHQAAIINELQIIGAGKRNVDCPKCASSDRDRLVFQFILEQNIHPQKILHIAPEKPLYNALKRQFNKEIIGLDNRSKGYRFAYGNHVIQGDIRRLDFTENQFDLIICNHVLEHVVEEETALKEIQRVLKPNGMAIIQIPFSRLHNETIEADPTWDSKIREKKLGQWDHVRLYGSGFTKKWESWGLQVSLGTLNESNTYKVHRLCKQEPIITIRK